MASNGGFIPYSRGRFCTATAARRSGRLALVYSLGRFRKQWPEKRPLMAGKTARLPDEGDGLLDIRIRLGVLAVLFVGRETRKAEHRQRYVALSLGWQKIAVMRAAEARHQLQPHRSILLEIGELAQRDFVAQITGDHVRVAPGSEATGSYHTRWRQRSLARQPAHSGLRVLCQRPRQLGRRHVPAQPKRLPRPEIGEVDLAGFFGSRLQRSK